MTATDPSVSIAVLSASMRLSEKTLTVAYMAGKVPLPDSICRNERGPAIRGWRLSTIRAWNRPVAARCAAILEALDKIPLKAA